MEKYIYKDSGVIWLGNVPKHWKVDRIKDKTTAVVGGDWGNDIDSETEGDDIVVLRVADLDDIYFKFEDLTFRKIKDGSFKSRRVTEKSLIIEKSGGGEKQLVGRVGHPKGIDFDAICSNFMAKIEFDNTIDLRFANYLFSALYKSHLNFPFVQQTTGIQNLNVTYYLTTVAAFPPIDEQNVIADYLDLTITRLDRIIAVKQEQLKNIDSYFHTKLHETITKGIGYNEYKLGNDYYMKDIPENWIIDRIKDVCEFNPPKNKIRCEKDEIVSVFPMEHISDDGKIQGRDEMEYGEVDSGLNYFENGDVIFAKITPCMENGKGAFIQNIPTKVAFGSTEFFVLRPNFRVLGKYLYYSTRNYKFRDYLEANMKGAAGQQRVTSKFFQFCEICFPKSIDEQQKIVDYIDSLKIKTDNLIEKGIAQIDTLKAYRKSLIHECVTGKKQVV